MQWFYKALKIAVLILPMVAANAETLRSEPLETDAAFRFYAGIDGDDAYVVYQMPPGIYLYRERLQLTTATPGFSLEEMRLPPGKTHDDPFFGKTEVYYTAVTLRSKINGTGQFELAAVSQGCDEQIGICYPPRNDIALLQFNGVGNDSISNDATDNDGGGIIANKADEAVKIIEQSDLLWIIVAFFGFGLLLSFTPCVLPMVPVLLGIIAGGGGRKSSVMLTFSYVSGVITAYTIFGVLAGLSGQLLSSALQNPPALMATATIFIILALSMFGLYDIRLPAFVQQRFGSLGRGGKAGGAFVMGAFSALVLSPCVAAPLVGALVYIGKTQNAALGAAALAALALGMNMLLIAAGLTAGVALPKSGEWMEEVKKIFGILFLAVAVWVVSPLIPIFVQMLLYGAVLIGLGTQLKALDALPPTAGLVARTAKTGGLIALLWGVIMLLGAASGGRDVLQPLSHLSLSPSISVSEKLQFRTVKSVSELQNALADAAGRPVMLDFYADWCVSCKEFEHFTLSDERVQSRLKNALLLRADVTENNEAQQKLLKRFDLFGPPAFLFYSRLGELNENVRVIGYESADDFLDILDAAGI